MEPRGTDSAAASFSDPAGESGVETWGWGRPAGKEVWAKGPLSSFVLQVGPRRAREELPEVTEGGGQRLLSPEC